MRVESSPATQSLGHNLLVVRRIFMLILSIVLIASFCASIAASAAENVFKITNTSLIEASQNVEEDFEATDEANISDALLFHRVGDYAKFKITLNNSDSINHTIESITDDNDNEYIALEYANYAGTAVNSGDSFDFLLTIKYNAAVDDINNRDQISNFKLYIKYAESEKPDEIDPSSPDTSDNFKVAITILVISATGLLICLVKAKRIDHRVTKTIAVITLVVSPFVISNNTQAASEGTDILVFTGEYHLYDQLVITLDNSGAESTTIVNYNTTVGSITKPAAPNGYEFDTWKDKDGNPISDSTKLTEDTKLFAGYKIITYTIRYEGLESGEDQGLPTEYNIETSVKIAPLATRKDDDGDDSETFVGWKDENDVVSQTVTIPTGQTGDRTFEATWEDVPLTTYTATCNLNGGQGKDSYTFNKKTETFAIQNPTKDFYDFKGWSGTDLVGEENTDVKVKKGTRKNLQFVAHYTPTKYTISYTGLEDSELTDRPTSYNYESTIHLENPADRFDSDGDKTQSFNGWSSTDYTITDNKNVTFQNEHGNKTFNANWTTVAPTEYTVTYNYNNGEDPGNETKFTKYESINVENPTRDYYIFAGWTGEGIDITDKMHVTIPVGTRNNVTLNATWTPVEYNIVYANLTETESANFTKKYTVESGPISLTNPADRDNDDEHFVKWTSTDVDVSNPSSIVVADKHKDITITANWEANTHDLHIDLNGGTTAQANPTTFTKETETFTLIEPTKNGYEFKGWSGTGLDGDSNKDVKVEKGTKRDLDFEAHYTAINYSINYTNVNDNEKATKELPESYTIETAKTIAKLDDRFDSDGDKTQRFVGWQAEGQSGTSETVSIPLGTTGNKSYIAIWENVDLPSYNITYTLNEGTNDDNNPANYNKNDLPLTINQPTREYYTFVGWTSEALGINEPQKNITIPSGTKAGIDLTANWTPVEYNIVYANLTETESAGYTKKYTVETNSISLTNPADRENADEHFVEWTSSDVDVSDPTNISLEGLYKNITITANWAANTHSLNINLDGGTTEPNNPTSFTKNTETFTLIEPTKNGYEFKGWSGTGLEGDSNKNVQVVKGTKEDLSFVANYTAINYSIEYEGVTSEEKAAKELPESYTIETAKTIAKLDDRSNDGDLTQRFIGWKTEDEEATSETITIPAGTTGAKKYIAVWEDVEYPPVYSITYELNGGTVSGNPTSYTKQDSNFTLNNPSKTGYNFTGWSGSHLDGEANTEVTVQTNNWRENLTFTAHFSPIQYNVNFNTNLPATVTADASDDITIDNLTCTYNSSCIIPDKTLNLVGYTFGGWNTQSDGQGTTYAKGTDITNIRDTAGEIVLYAKWLANPSTNYTIEFYFENADDNDFTKDSSKTRVEQGQTGAQTAAIDTSAQDYAFPNFTFDSNNANNILSDTIERHGNTILKLYYTRNTFNVAFNANGGRISGTDPESEIITITKKHGATISESDFPEAIKLGSDFDGWFTTAEGGDEVTSIMVPTNNDTVVFAHWTTPVLCKKATSLEDHVLQCNRNDGNGCQDQKIGYSTSGSKKTTTAIIGDLSSGTDNFTRGDAFDCNISGNGYDDRFYFVRTNGDNAVLIASDSYESNGWARTHEHPTQNDGKYIYANAPQQLPAKSDWNSNLVSFTYGDAEYAARLPKEADIRAACNVATGTIKLTDCDFLFENTKHFNTNTALDGIWIENPNPGEANNYIRIQANSVAYETNKPKTSINTVRPVIEVPMSLMDTHALDHITITFNTGNNDITPWSIPIGGALRLHTLPTPTTGSQAFIGWYKDPELTEPVDDSMLVDEDTTFYAKFEATAQAKDRSFSTLQAAIDYVTASDGEITVTLFTDLTGNKAEEIKIDNGRNINLDLQNHTVANKGAKTNVIKVLNGTLKISNGTITSNGTNGAVDVDPNGTLIMTGGTISATNTKQAIYIDGGNVTISGNSQLSSTTNQRATIHNLNGGTLTITGGTITSTGTCAIHNELGTLTIGTDNGVVDPDAILIHGVNYGVVANTTNNTTYNFYDGIIEGNTWPTGQTATTGTTTPSITTDQTGAHILNWDSNSYLDYYDTTATTKKLRLSPSN